MMKTSHPDGEAILDDENRERVLVGTSSLQMRRIEGAGDSGEKSNENIAAVPDSADLSISGGILFFTQEPTAREDVSQPAGESSVSRETQEREANVGLAVSPTKPRSQSECTFTSYEALEGSLKDAMNESNAELGEDSITKNETFSKKSSAPTSSDENEDDSPEASALEHSDESAVSDDAQPGEGPPRVITTTSSGRSSSPKGKNLLRRGKWTVEEEAYVARVIQDFNSGFLDAPAGTTLRTYLSEKLQCDPMRITKKFTGDACIGKRVFHPAVRSPSNASAIDKAQAELENLEKRWRRRLELQQRESAKKAAAAAVAVGRGLHDGSFDPSAHGSRRANSVTRTASWLDRANLVLNEQSVHEAESYIDEAVDIQVQMQEVQRLIHEGPIIQQTSAELPEMIDQAEQEALDIASTAAAAAAEVEPADKRMRTAEDAEALVGFLRSVRASAASGVDHF